MLSLLSTLEEGSEDDEDDDKVSRLHKSLLIFPVMEISKQACKLAAMLGKVLFTHFQHKQALKLAVMMGDFLSTHVHFISSKLSINLELVLSFLHEMKDYVHIIHPMAKGGQIQYVNIPLDIEGARGHQGTHQFSRSALEKDKEKAFHCSAFAVFGWNSSKSSRLSDVQSVVKVLIALDEPDGLLHVMKGFFQAFTVVGKVGASHLLKEEKVGIQPREAKLRSNEFISVLKRLVEADDCIVLTLEQRCLLKITEEKVRTFPFVGSLLLVLNISLFWSSLVMSFDEGGNVGSSSGTSPVLHGAQGGATMTPYVEDSYLDFRRGFLFFELCFLPAWFCSELLVVLGGEDGCFSLFLQVLTGCTRKVFTVGVVNGHVLSHGPVDNWCLMKGPAVHANSDFGATDRLHVVHGGVLWMVCPTDIKASPMQSPFLDMGLLQKDLPTDARHCRLYLPHSRNHVTLTGLKKWLLVPSIAMFIQGPLVHVFSSRGPPFTHSYGRTLCCYLSFAVSLYLDVPLHAKSRTKEFKRICLNFKTTHVHQEEEICSSLFQVVNSFRNLFCKRDVLFSI